MPKVPLSQGPQQKSGALPAAMEQPNWAWRANAPDAQLRPSLLATPQLSEQRLVTPQLSYQSANPDAFGHVQLGDGGAAQDEQMGRNLASASATIGDAVLQYQRQFNATAADAALSQARTKALDLQYGQADAQGNMQGGYANLRGASAVFGVQNDSGKTVPLDQWVGDNFDRSTQDIRAKLTNDDQRYAFDLQVGDIKHQLVTGAMSHVAQQAQAWQQNTYTDAAKNAASSFAQIDANDSAGQLKALDEMSRYAYTAGKVVGAPPQSIYGMQMATRSSAIGGMLDTLISKENYHGASALLNTYAPMKDANGVPYLDPNVAAKYREQLNTQVATSTGMQLGQTWAQQRLMPAIAPNQSVTRLVNLVQHRESPHGDLNPDGTVITSPKGAKGGMQVLDTTNKNPGFGVKPAQDDSLAERARVGRDYLTALVSHYGGDVQKGLAAYNWGPHNLDTAMQAYGPAWLQHAPHETQSYVADISRQMTLGEGAPPMPTREDGYAYVNAQSQDPRVRKAGYEQVDQLVSAAEQSHKATQDNAYQTALQQVTANNGDWGKVDQNVIAAMDATKLPDLQSYAKTLQSGGYNTTHGADYWHAYAMADDPHTTQAQMLAWKTKLADEDWKAVSKKYQDAQMPQPGKGPDSLDNTALHGLVMNALATRGVDINPKKTDTAQLAYLGNVQRFVDQYVLDQQKATGKKFEDYGKLKAVVDQMFLNEPKFKNVWLGGLTTSLPSKPALTMTPRDLDGDTRNQLKDWLKNGVPGRDGKRRGGFGRDPSDTELMAAYWRRQFYP